MPITIQKNVENPKLGMIKSDLMLGRKVCIINKKSGKKIRKTIKSINNDNTVTLGLYKSKEYNIDEIIFPKRYFKQISTN